MIVTGLLVGAALGLVLQRGRFCITGAYRDLWVSHSWRWFTAFLLAIAVQAVGVLLLTWTGVIRPEASELSVVATVVGSFLFGVGIVLAGGCATGTYYRAGEGLVGSWFALVAYALSAVAVGIIAALAWPLSWASGREDGLGITTPSSNLVRFIVTGDASAVNWGVLLVLGILIGSYLSAKASGEFRVRVPSATVINRSIGGGVLMGVGAAWAGGCSIGNALVQTSLLGWQGWIALVFQALGVGAAAYVVLIRPRNRRRAAKERAALTASTADDDLVTTAL